MSIAFLILYILISHLLYSIVSWKNLGLGFYPFGTTVFCLVIHIVLLVTSIWHFGWLLGVILFLTHFFGIVQMSFGWIFSIPILLKQNDEKLLLAARIETALLTPAALVTIAFCIVSFFTVEYKETYFFFIDENRIFGISIVVAAIVLFVVRILAMPKLTKEQ